AGIVNRVILLTDGNPTVGKTDGREFVSLAQNMREAGITITAIGIGTDYNESLLQKVAESAGGLWHHIDAGKGDLPQVFQDQAAQMAGTVVSNPELKVSIMPGSELADAYSVRPVLNRLPRPKLEVGAREGGDDHADARDGCGRGRRGSVEPRAERRRHDDAGCAGDGGAERPPVERVRQEGFPSGDDDYREEEAEEVMS